MCSVNYLTLMIHRFLRNDTNQYYSQAVLEQIYLAWTGTGRSGDEFSVSRALPIARQQWVKRRILSRPTYRVFPLPA